MIIGPKVSHQSIDGEVVIIDLQTGSYFSLQDLAARLWELIAAGRSRAELVALVEATFPGNETAAEETHGFIDDLVLEGLVVETMAAARTPVAVELPSSFTPPRFEKFTDMQELLMLDPIHEVDASGWPNKPAGA